MPIVIGSWLMPKLGRRIHWLGKKELFDWPLVGWAAANGGVHPVDRGAADVEAFRLAQRILDEGNVLFVFPEGTRSPTARSRRRTTASRSSPSGPAPRSSRSASPARTASGRRARSCRTPAATSRSASGARSACRRADPAGHGPADRERPRDDR